MLGEKIKTLRISRGLNQIELSKILGVTKQCVSNWENDNIQPSIEMLIKLSNYFNISADYLLGLNTTTKISLDGLTDKEIAHITLLIEDLKNNK